LDAWHRKEKKKAVLVAPDTPYAEAVKLAYDTTPFGDLILWTIQLHTGKYHQIRVQLAGEGCPIIGDALYGSTVPYKPDAIALHACRLTIAHPLTNKNLEFSSDPDWTL
jgi:23S rRNA-/tRNA-specific pseudouridylate synthase